MVPLALLLRHKKAQRGKDARTSIHTDTRHIRPHLVRPKGKYQLVILGYQSIVHPGISADIHFSVEETLFWPEATSRNITVCVYEKWIKTIMRRNSIAEIRFSIFPRHFIKHISLHIVYLSDEN